MLLRYKLDNLISKRAVRTPFVVIEKTYIEAHDTQVFLRGFLALGELDKAMHEGQSDNKQNTGEEEPPATTYDPYPYEYHIGQHQNRSKDSQGGVFKVLRRHKRE